MCVCLFEREEWDGEEFKDHQEHYLNSYEPLSELKSKPLMFLKKKNLWLQYHTLKRFPQARQQTLNEICHHFKLQVT